MRAMLFTELFMPLVPTKAKLDFPRYQNDFTIPKENTNKTWTMVGKIENKMLSVCSPLILHSDCQRLKPPVFQQ